MNARAISGPPSRRYACSTTAFVRFTGELFALFREEGKKKASSSSPSSKEDVEERRCAKMSSKMLLRFCSSSPSLREEPSWTRSTGHKIHDPFRAPPPPTRLGNGHEGWISFRLLLNLPGHKTRGGVAPRGYVLSARES